MPMLHVQCEATARRPDGRVIPLPPGQPLVLTGPRVPVSVAVPSEVAQFLTQSGRPIPQPVAGFGLVDTGAAASCVDNTVAEQLQLPVVDVIRVATASHSDFETNVYPVTFDLVGVLGGQRITVVCPKASGLDLAAQGIILLIGRDLLAGALLCYNGRTGQFTLCF